MADIQNDGILKGTLVDTVSLNEDQVHQLLYLINKERMGEGDTQLLISLNVLEARLLDGKVKLDNDTFDVMPETKD